MTRFYVFFVLLGFLLIISLGAIGVAISYTAKNSREGAYAHAALCSFKADLYERIEAERVATARSEQFLKDHPAGIPGIPANLFKQSISTQKNIILNQTKTYDSIDGILSC